MNDKLIGKIHSFTLSARALLEKDLGEQLEGTYGWLPDGSFGLAKHYPALQPDGEREVSAGGETRRRLEKWAAEEAEAGLRAKAARKKLIDEGTFTWLNRLVGFKMLESRSLIRETIGRLWDSNGFKRWVTRPENAEDYANFEAGDMPQNLRGEGPRQCAYRHFLASQCATLAADVSLLFDPNSLDTRLCPRPLALKGLVDLLNQTKEAAKEDDPDFADIWKPGNEEAIGWIYQAFNSEALEAAFAEARQNNTKFAPSDIPAVTQLFTLRWVVRLLVENTLGRIWLEMHPDSRLKDKWSYLALPANPQQRPVRPVAELTFLDPCCGSMHFGLQAFDLFVDMYAEELERGGQPGWPETASVANADAIPASIIAHNLHGIDIDLRAVQLSALALLVRARTLQKEAPFTDANLACANVEKLSGGKLEQFIRESQFSHPIYERILLKMAERLKDSENLGSLLRLEQDLRRLVDKERKSAEEMGQFELAIPGLTEETFETEAGIEEFFGVLTEQILRHLDNFVSRSRASNDEEGHFVGEAAKGMRYLRLVSRDYDVVATNPPYLSGRKMNKRMTTLMKSEYPEGSGDLYAAFITRCQELLQDSGLMGMLTMHSFMFISSYEKLRDLLRAKVAVDTLAHFGGHLFAVGNPGTLQTAAFVLRKEPDVQKRDNHTGTYFRLVKETSSEAKRLAFEEAVAAQRAGNPHPQLFSYMQQDFNVIPGKPWCYWMPRNICSLFRTFNLLKNSAPPRQGLATADNNRFLRKWWEVSNDALERHAVDCNSSSRKGRRWFPYMKGGTPIAWYGNQEHILNWESDGIQIDSFRPKSVIRNPSFYFRKGVTWSLTSSKGFAARISPGGFIFDVNGMTCFPAENILSNVLGIMNSRVGKFLLSSINPTIAFQVGDIERLPIPSQKSATLNELVQEAIALAKQNSAESERTYDFVAPLATPADHDARMAKLAEVEAAIDAEVTRLYGLTEEDFEVINRELAITKAAAEGADAETAGEDDEAEDGEAATGYSAEAWGRSWVSYAVGVVIGRFAVGEPDGLGHGNFSEEVNKALRGLRAPNGLLVSDAGHPLDMTARTLAALELMLGGAGAKKVIREGCGEGEAEAQLRAWLDGEFWAYHMQLYRNRPVYWPFETDTRKAACRYRIWCFHEKLSNNTLFQVQRLATEKINFLNSRIGELQESMQAAGSRKEARNLEMKKEETEVFIDTLRTFIKAINDIANGTGDTLTGWERRTAYIPHIDDGVVINAAPLWPLLPKWKQNGKRILKETWQKMATTDKLDWAEQAMEYWPTRVTESCKGNKSIAIAHGTEDLYQG